LLNCRVLLPMMACTTIRRSLFVSTGFRQQPCGLLGILCCTWHAEYYSSSVMVSCFDADSMPVQQPVGKFTYMAGGCVYVAITGGTVVQPCVNSHWLSQWEPCIFDPPQNRCPLTKFCRTCAAVLVWNRYEKNCPGRQSCQRWNRHLLALQLPQCHTKCISKSNKVDDSDTGGPESGNNTDD